jgi:hypothetical protein
MPSPRARFYSCQVNENLYVLIEDEEDPENFPKL